MAHSKLLKMVCDHVFAGVPFTVENFPDLLCHNCVNGMTTTGNDPKQAIEFVHLYCPDCIVSQIHIPCYIEGCSNRAVQFIICKQHSHGHYLCGYCIDTSPSCKHLGK